MTECTSQQVFNCALVCVNTFLSECRRRRKEEEERGKKKSVNVNEKDESKRGRIDIQKKAADQLIYDLVIALAVMANTVSLTVKIWMVGLISVFTL